MDDTHVRLLGRSIKFYQMIMLKIIKQTLLVCLLCVYLYSSKEVEQKLPFLQQRLLPQSIKGYQTQQKQSFFLQCSPEAGILGKLPHACHIHNAYIDIHPLSQIDYDHSEKKKYLYNPHPPTIYTIDQSELVAHYIGEEYHKLKDKEVFKFDRNCSKDMVFEFGRQKMFIFSCQAVYEMTMDGSALRMRELMKNQEHIDVRSAERFEDLIILITYTKGVFIYAVDAGIKLHSLGKIQLSSDNETEIVDAYYGKGELVLLDRYNGLEYYKRNRNQFVYVDSLGLNLDGDVEYLFLEIWKNTTFMAMETETQSFVVQLQNFKKKVYLVRYYKGYEQILKIQLYNHSLIIHSNSKLDLFPINRDPRTIKQTLNGYSYSHDESVLSFQHLAADRFLLLRGKSASLTQWSLINKKIQCDFAQAGSYSIMLEYPCGPNTDDAFWYACSQVSVSMITVYHKDTYIWLLLIVIGAFLAAVMMLIFWRESKVAKIVHILLKIKTFSQRKKELQLKERKEMFVEDKSKSLPNDLGQSQEGDKEQEMEPYEAYIKSQRDNLH